jgi:hypothetical protein
VTPPSSEPDGNPTTGVMSELNGNPMTEATQSTDETTRTLCEGMAKSTIWNANEKYTKENKENIPPNLDEWNTPQDTANYLNLVQWHNQAEMFKHQTWVTLLGEGLAHPDDEEDWWELYDHNGRLYPSNRPRCGQCLTCNIQESRENGYLAHPGTRIETAWDKKGSYDKSLDLEETYQQTQTMDPQRGPKDRRDHAREQWNQDHLDETRKKLEQRERELRRRKREQKLKLERQDANITENWDAAFTEYLERRNQEEEEAARLSKRDKLRQAASHALRERLTVPLSYEPALKKAEEPRYDDDHRNPTHDFVHWRFCYNDNCKTHYQIKWDESYFPEPKSKCKWQWYDCHKDKCKWHLWDKRVADFFPGFDSEHDARRHVIINGNCQNEDWQVCMHQMCAKHLDQKVRNGFDEKTFLERIKWLGEPTPTRPESDSESEEQDYASAPEDSTISGRKGSSSSQ